MHGKSGGSRVWYMTLVLGDQRAADEFKQWLGQNARRENIRRLVGADRGAGDAYVDVVFHRGRLKSRLRLLLGLVRYRLGMVWRVARWLPFKVWRRVKS